MFDEMHEIGGQLALKWARQGPQAPLDVGGDVTRLALDTPALCSMGFRFNSYYRQDLHPFIQAMNEVMDAAAQRTNRFMPSVFYHSTNCRFKENIRLLRSTAREVVDSRSLAADSGAVTLEHVSKLKYITALIRETMRLNAPITAFAREAVGDQIIGGKYLVKKDTQVVCFLTRSQSDPVIWGPDANVFRPERMLEANFDRMQKEYPHCWAPFGTGLRACIGRPFAWQEMVLALAVLLQNFNFITQNPAYTLRLAQSLTIKPKDLYLRAISREGLAPAQLEARLAGAFGGAGAGGTTASPLGSPSSSPQAESALPTGRKVAIYYGSNSGTCEFMAQRLASDAKDHGYTACVDILDAAKEALPTGCPVVIIAASYEGQPTHNASHFVNWIQNLEDDKKLEGARYAVWGCGAGSGGYSPGKTRSLSDGAHGDHQCNAKDRDMFSDFETWEDHTLWPAIKQHFGESAAGSEDTSPTVQATITTPRPSDLRQDVQESLVLDARRLSKKDDAGAGGKRHLEIQLPSGCTYAAGDYLAVLPHNPKETVGRVMRRFRLAWDAHISIASPHPTTLPTNVSLPVSEVLGSYVELNQVATKRNIITLGQFADGEIKEKISRLATDGFEDEIRSRYLSVLGILEQFADIHIPFGCFLSMLPPMRVRQYSISSSPLANPGTLTLTYSVLDAPAYSGVGRHVGAASLYLSGLLPGDRIQASVRAAAGGFRLPLEPAKTPIVCIAAGTGVAPFRAFVQERWVLCTTKKQELAPALLFYGCRDAADDDLYRDEFDAWERAGAVTVYRAYSRRRGGATDDEGEAADGCRYVQERLWRERAAVGALWRREARFYVCGATRMAQAVKGVLVRIVQTESGRGGGPAMTEEEAARWFDTHRNERFATDVFD
ncbi:bifunctional p-450: NADPH-p450 reductase [Apiospora aurea]|uniref:Bifunctional p-450: NADPH-p450 reductase n=1 Tax=Apiospora aurea TaxID=335848 RepID=A0ABR1QYX4_9PEZI